LDDRIGFLHIGKTGGTSLLSALSNTIDVTVFHHHATLRQAVEAYPDIKMIFFVRDPVSRFVSSFYSRQRCGRPRYNSPWSADEADAFGTFASPTALAEALSETGLRRAAAVRAMRAICHIREPLTQYLGSPSELDSFRRNILFIGTQESLSRDFTKLKSLLVLPSDVALPTDPVEAHRAPAPPEPLSSLAQFNIRNWYDSDYALIKWCNSWRRDHAASMRKAPGSRSYLRHFLANMLPPLRSS
jgi:hypothetical protein